jgi:hypothetical protein
VRRSTLPIEGVYRINESLGGLSVKRSIGPSLALVLCLGSLAACDVKLDAGNEDSGPVNYRVQPLQGKIGGANWLLASGRATRNGSRLFIDITDQTLADPCSGFGFGDRVVMTTVNDGIGETILGKAPDFHSVTLAYTNASGSQNYIAMKGGIVVDDINATHVSGRMAATYNSSNQVNGDFDVTFCP